MHDHRQPMRARQLQLSVKEAFLLGGIQARDEAVETDLAHRDQPRVVAPATQFLVEQRQVLVARAVGAQRMDAERVGIALQVREFAHRREVGRGHRGNHAEPDADLTGAGADAGHLRAEFRRIEVAVGVDEEGHREMMPEGMQGRGTRATVVATPTLF